MGQLSWLIIPRQYLLQIKSKEQKTHWLFSHNTSGLSLSMSNTGSNEPLRCWQYLQSYKRKFIRLKRMERKWNQSPHPETCLQSPSEAPGLIISSFFLLTLSNPLLNLYLYVCLPIKLKAPWSRDHHFCIPMYII